MSEPLRKSTSPFNTVQQRAQTGPALAANEADAPQAPTLQARSRVKAEDALPTLATLPAPAGAPELILQYGASDRVAILQAGYSSLLEASQRWPQPGLHPYWGIPSNLTFRIVRRAAAQLALLSEPRPLLRLLRNVGAVNRASFVLKLAVIRSLPQPLRLQLAALDSLLLNEYASRKNTRPVTTSPQSHRDYLALRWSLDFLADSRWSITGLLASSADKEDWHKPLWALHRWKLTPRTDWSGWRALVALHPQDLQALTLDLNLVIDEEKAAFLASCPGLGTLRLVWSVERRDQAPPDLRWLERLPQIRCLSLPANLSANDLPQATLARLSRLAITEAQHPRSPMLIPTSLPTTAQLEIASRAQDFPDLQGRNLSALSVDRLTLGLALRFPKSVRRLEVIKNDEFLESALRLASQLSELVLDGNLHDLEALHAWLARPDCPLRILTLRNLPKGEDQHKLIKGLQANVSLQELSLQSPQGLNAKGITPALAKLILEHPGLRKLTVQLCNVKSFDKAMEPVLTALRNNRRLRWVTLHLHKNQSLDCAEEQALRKQLAQIIQDNRNLFRFDYSIAGQVTNLGNWRY